MPFGLPAIGETSWGQKILDSIEAVKATADAAQKPTVVMSGTGIDPTGATDSTSAMQAKLNTLPASGGSVYIPAGVYKVTGLTCSVPVTIVGAGGALVSNDPADPVRGVTTLVCTSATANALTLSAQATTITDLAIVNEAATTPTAGAGIRAATLSNGHLERITVQGFYDGVDIGGMYWTLANSHIYDPVRYGVYIHTDDPLYFDHGDFGVLNNVITSFLLNRDAESGIRWECGGGIRIVGNKINGATLGGNPEAPANGKFNDGIAIMPADGTATVDIGITGNRLSNCRRASLYMGTKGPAHTGVINGGAIVGNGFDASPSGVKIAKAGSGQVSDVVISGNMFAGCGTNAGIHVDAASGVAIGPNIHRQTGSAAPVWIGAGSAQVSVAPQTVIGSGIPLIQDSSAYDFSSHATRGLIQHTYSREIPSTTSSVTYTNLFRFSPAWYSSGVVEVVITGQVTNRGATTVKATRSYYMNSGVAAAVTVATVGTDATVGTAIDLLFDTSVAGEVTVKVRLNAAAGGDDLIGRCDLRINGVVGQVYKS